MPGLQDTEYIFRFDEAVTFEGYLIVPFDDHLRILSPTADLMTVPAKSIPEAQGQIVDYIIQDFTSTYIQSWLRRGVISEAQADQMEADIQDSMGELSRPASKPMS